MNMEKRLTLKYCLRNINNISALIHATNENYNYLIQTIKEKI